MAKKDEQRNVKPITWVVWVALAVFIFLLGLAFFRAFVTNHTLRQERAAVRPILTAAQEDQTELLERLDYVKSDEYIEEWSRTDAMMTKPGEVLVINVVVTPTPAPVAAPPVSTPAPSSVPFWQRWWDSLFGSD